MKPQPKTKRLDLPAYRAWVAMQPCHNCGRAATDDNPNSPAHQSDLSRKYYDLSRYDGGTALKTGDNLILPECNDCHAGIEHQQGRGGMKSEEERLAAIVNLLTQYYIEC